MSTKKNPEDYNYGKPCEDHLGNPFKTMKAMCESYGIPYSTYLRRKKNGWELERILTTPPRGYTWNSPGRNLGMPMTKAQKRIKFCYNYDAIMIQL